ncbi:hypothetical protein BT69DRAFT_1333829 [Atractiella rhizophila]|nr:hypothetical protein BT69DRAFT_1333829 [Atractiella rhizophila]
MVLRPLVPLLTNSGMQLPLPHTVLYSLLVSFLLPPLPLPKILTFIISIFVIHNLSIFTADWNEARNARRYNARVVPKSVPKRRWIPGSEIARMFELGKAARKLEPGELASIQRDKVGAPIINSVVPGRYAISTWEPNHMKQVLTTNFENYGKDKTFITNLKDFLGDGVFNSDQKGLWQFHRTLTRPHFSKDEVNDYSHFRQHCDKLLEYFSRAASTNRAVDVQEAFGRFTIDAGSELFFGRRETEKGRNSWRLLKTRRITPWIDLAGVR